MPDQLIVLTAAIFLCGLTVTIFIWPDRARSFLSAFASSARAHYLELGLRILVGAALISYSPGMWQSQIFRAFGWIIVATSIVLACIPWQWHRKFASWVVPTVIRYMRLYGVGAAALAILLFYGVFAGPAKSGG